MESPCRDCPERNYCSEQCIKMEVNTKQLIKPKQTNYDRIRNMSMEDMAECYAESVMHQMEVSSCFTKIMSTTEKRLIKDTILRSAYNWLNQPVESRINKWINQS